MASLMKKTTVSSSPAASSVSVVVLHEGWCVKESGTAFLGRTNWRKRLFRLVQKGDTVTLQYFRSRNDKKPAGSVKLDPTYCTRPLESHEKPQPNCFAVGPLIDDGAIRTYYISCQSQLIMQEWMTVIDAAIQGVPELAQRRRQTVSHKYSLRAQRKHKDQALRSKINKMDSLGESDERGLTLTLSTQVSVGVEETSLGATVDTNLDHEDLSDDEVWESVEDEVSEEEDEEGEGRGASALPSRCRTFTSPDSSVRPSSRLLLYDSPEWRMERWHELRHTVKTMHWNKVDVKDGVTVARCKFGRSSQGHAVIKVEGVLPADPSTVFQFLQLSTREGGKLDYLFRNETLIQEIEKEPKGNIIFNEFLLPLPRVSKRDVAVMKLWIPEYLTHNGTAGFVMFSVDHPEAPQPEKDARRINVNPSGLLLSPHPGPGGAVHTHTTILVQVAFYGALHRMLKGAYNSGLLKLGLRTTFFHIVDQLQRFVEVTDI